jgi:hypothetical protein
MIRTLFCFIVIVASIVSPLFAQSDNGRKQAAAVRVPSGSIEVDGRLNEETWQRANAITDFVQKEPLEGQPPTDRLEVRFAYDDRALYVGARMFSAEPIQAPMGRRDNVDQAEHLLISLDSYLDRLTASTFGVTATGVRLDHYHPSDTEFNTVSEFDPVWRANAAIIDDGWTAEFWIPFSQLRFNDRSPQIWGLNVRRWIPSRNEEVYWVLVPRTDRGWASRFGELTGIDGLRPSRRLELVPYVSGTSTLTGEPNAANPFDERFSGNGQVGLDAKVGIGSNLTLDATVNPDFGQVEADPAEVNLSAFETFFDERRPFFLEGSQLLTGSVQNYFYSRRIGATPAGPASGDFVDYPRTTTILGAAKLTGRLSSGLSVGVLGALTAEEDARTYASSLQLLNRVRVAPQTTYGVARLQQEFGAEASTVGLLATVVHRGMSADDPLSSLLTRNAYSLSGDSLLRFKDGQYEIPIDMGFTYVAGTAGAIDRVQRHSARYFQRPDVDYVNYDPSRTSLVGGRIGTGIERRNGRHWIWNVRAWRESPEFESNDIGRLSSADSQTIRGEIEFRETVPSRWFRSYSVSLFNNNEWDYGADRLRGQLQPQISVTLPNFWEIESTTILNPRVMDPRLTRGGPTMEKPRDWLTEVQIESSDSSQTRGRVELGYGRTEDGGLTFRTEGGLSMQPSPRWLLSLNPSYERRVETQQYVSTLDGGGAQTFGRRYVFGHIDRSTYSAEIRMNYTFKPDLNLDLYAEPFAASGRYERFGELEAARGRSLRIYGTDGTGITTLPDGRHVVTDAGSTFTLRNVDFNVLSFRSNLVLRWEWRPGSTLYVVWQQDRSQREDVGTRATPSGLFDSLTAPGNNFFVVKASFWFSVS